MRDYWLNKMMFDAATPEGTAALRADRAKFYDKYPLKPQIREALLGDDVAALFPMVNPYILRFYFFSAGMKDAEFIRRLRTVDPKVAAEAAHG
jgi:hypothetical protein